ncbi:MAG: DUF4340 domain-containing protein [Patescibacteria group bacterium]|jgi:hypothetical protein
MPKLNSTTIILIGTFVLLVGIFSWQYWSKASTQKQATVQKQFISDFSVDAVTELSITKGDTTTTLQKQSDQWVITSNNNVAADDSAIKALLNTLHDSTIQATITNTTDQAELYGLDQAQVIHIVAKNNGQTVADVQVGKIGKAYNTWYGTRNTDQTVYLLSGSHTSLVNDKWENV